MARGGYQGLDKVMVLSCLSLILKECDLVWGQKGYDSRPSVIWSSRPQRRRIDALEEVTSENERLPSPGRPAVAVLVFFPRAARAFFVPADLR
jgi:hypothetical protein